jgi:acetyl esterase/lipase
MVTELIATIDIAGLTGEVLPADLTGLPPTLVQLAGLDVLRSDGEALAAKLQAADVKVELAIFPGVLHRFMRAMATVGKTRTAVDNAGAWLHGAR